MDIIWDKYDLIKIKKHANKFGLTINNNQLVDKPYTSDDFYHYTLSKDKESFKKLFYCQDKKEIDNILKLTIPLKYVVKNNKGNPMCIGLLTNLSEIDPNNRTEIFKVLEELTAEYTRTISKVSSKIAEYCKTPEELKKTIMRINASEVDTNEIIFIKNYLNKLLPHTNGIAEKSLFKDAIRKCESEIKDNLLNSLIVKYNSIIERREKIKCQQNCSYKVETIYKLSRKKHKII